MICKNCGGDLNLKGNVYICTNCNTSFKIETIFENTEICICYIENDKNGRRTKDSIIAQEVYQKLEYKKINTFYERVAAADIVGDDLEKIRNSAIFCAEAIVLVGTNLGNINDILNKFSDLFVNKQILPVISDLKPDELPSQLRKFQVLSLDTIGALDDLSKSVLNLLGRGDEIELEEIYNNKARKKKFVLVSIIFLVAILFCVAIVSGIGFLNKEKDEQPVITNTDIYNSAVVLVNEGKYLEAVKEFEKILEYKDSDNQIKNIYNQYDGYYKKDNITLFVDVQGGKVAEITVEKHTSNGIVKLEETVNIVNNVFFVKTNDSIGNEIEFSGKFNNNGIVIEITDTNNVSGISFEKVYEEFVFSIKTDYEFKKITKEQLFKWIDEEVTIKELAAEGYTAIYKEPASDFNSAMTNKSSDVFIYSIEFTDIDLVVTKYKTKEKDEYLYLTDEENDSPYVLGIIAPANIVCKNKIGEEANAFSDENFLYLCDAREFNCDLCVAEGIDDKLAIISYGFQTPDNNIIKSSTRIGLLSKNALPSKTIELAEEIHSSYPDVDAHSGARCEVYDFEHMRYYNLHSGN